MTQLVQALVLGLLIGGVYALMASGLTLIFGVMNIINVAQGRCSSWSRSSPGGLVGTPGSTRSSLSVVMTPVMFGFGWLLYKGVVSRISGSSPGMSVLLTFGIAITIEGVLNVTAGNKFRSATPSYFAQSFRVARHLAAQGAGVRLPRRGRSSSACSTSCSPGPGPAARSGRPRRTPRVPRSSASRRRGVAALAFAIGTATTGVGGSVLSVLYPFFPASHYDWISRLLGIIVLGGMGSLAGALVGRAHPGPGRDADGDLRVAAVVDAHLLRRDHDRAAVPPAGPVRVAAASGRDGMSARRPPRAR